MFNTEKEILLIKSGICTFFLAFGKLTKNYQIKIKVTENETIC